jgi:hypothetical protein
VLSRTSVDGVIVVGVFNMYLPRRYSDHRAILIVKVINMPGECTAFDDLEVGFVEVRGGCQARARKFRQGAQYQSVEEYCADIKQNAKRESVEICLIFFHSVVWVLGLIPLLSQYTVYKCSAKKASSTLGVLMLREGKRESKHKCMLG